MTLDQLKALPKIDRLSKKKTLTPSETVWLMNVLKNTPDSTVRNQAAIAMADLKVQGTDHLLIDLIKRPELKDDTGSLLYALGEYGGKLPLRLAVSLLVDGVWETREETLSLLENHGVTGDLPKELPDAVAKLQPLTHSSDEETAYIAQAAITALGSISQHSIRQPDE